MMLIAGEILAIFQKLLYSGYELCHKIHNLPVTNKPLI